MRERRETDKPPVELSPSRVLCTFHPRPWQATWSESAVIVMTFCIELFNVLVADEDFIKKCGADATKINAHMPIPLCCWVELHYPEKLKAAYEKVGVEPPDPKDRFTTFN